MCPDLSERVDRWKAFWESDEPGAILATVTTWNMDLDLSRFGVHPRPLDSWDYLRQTRELCEHRVRALRATEFVLKDLPCDHIPLMTPHIGIALNSLFFSGGGLVVDEHNAWTDHVLDEYSELDEIRPDPNNRWFQFTMECLRHFMELNEGDYAVLPLCQFSPADMANALRGNALFLDIHDRPDDIRRLLEKCVEGIAWMENSARRIVPQWEGGSCAFGTWCPGDLIAMSEDAPDLCSPETYAGLFRPYTEELAGRFGGCFIHHHALGMKVHPEILKIRGLRMAELSLDPNCSRPIDHLEEILEMHGPIPLMTRATPQDVYDKIDLLKQGRVFVSLDVGDVEDAREPLEFLRRHSRIQ